jgi:hypothetical protein
MEHECVECGDECDCYGNDFYDCDECSFCQTLDADYDHYDHYHG